MFKIKKCKKGMEYGSHFFIKSPTARKYFLSPMNGMSRDISEAYPYKIEDIRKHPDIKNLKQGFLELVHAETCIKLSKEETIKILEQ